LDVLLNDIENDDKVVVLNDGKDKYIQCKVNYPNNSTLYSEKIHIDNDYDVKKVEVLDKDGNVKINLDITDIDYKPKFDDDFFKLESLVNDDSNEDLSQEKVEKPNEETDEEKVIQNTSGVLEDIIYPLYIPQNTHLNTQDTVETDNGNRAILTFSGDSPFVLVEEVSYRCDDLEIIPVNGEPMILADSIGAVSNNSLYWTSNGIDYYLSSTTMNTEELMTIAEGLSGTSVIVSSEK